MFKLKKLLSAFLALAICVSLGTSALAADPQSAKADATKAKWGELNVVDQGLRIYAPVSDIMKYLQASDTEKEKVLKDLTSDSKNSVSKLDVASIEKAPAATEEANANAVALTQTVGGYWAITSHVVPAGGTTLYGPFYVCAPRYLHLSYKLSAKHNIGWSISRSTTGNVSSSYYQDYIESYLTVSTAGGAGNYYAKVKNYDSTSMTVTGNYIEVV